MLPAGSKVVTLLDAGDYTMLCRGKSIRVALGCHDVPAVFHGGKIAFGPPTFHMPLAYATAKSNWRQGNAAKSRPQRMIPEAGSSTRRSETSPGAGDECAPIADCSRPSRGRGAGA